MSSFIPVNVQSGEIPKVQKVLEANPHIEFGGGTPATDGVFFIRENQKGELQDICQNQGVSLTINPICPT